MLEQLISFFIKYKEPVDYIVLVSIILLQWPAFIIDRLIDYIPAEKRNKFQENVSLYNILPAILCLFGLYAVAYRLIDKAIMVYNVKHLLSLFGTVLFSLSVLLYIFIVYFFVSLAIYTLILYIKVINLKKQEHSEL